MTRHTEAADNEHRFAHGLPLPCKYCGHIPCECDYRSRVTGIDIRPPSAHSDTIPHCTNCEENPAAENDELCHPCAKARDAQPVRQENDAWGNRGGCSYRMDDLDRVVYERIERSAIRQRFTAIAR